MIILGAGGHAREVYEILDKAGSEIYFYDDITNNVPSTIFSVPVLCSESEAIEVLSKDNRVVIGIGSPKLRQLLAARFKTLRADITSVISSRAIVSENSCLIEEGVNIMHYSFISNNTRIGYGSVVNSRANIHHDVQIGKFCEIGPSAILLGQAEVGDFTFIGAGAVILPGIKIGPHCIVGAGAVVTKHLNSNTIVKGVPAK